MDLICASCVEWKSATSCVHISKLPIEKNFKYCTETELTKNSDGQFYCCITCKMSINDDKQPKRSQKEILGLLDFPKEFMDDLETHCTPWSKTRRQDPEKKYLELNRLEDYLLKPIIPFIRIGHLPRGRYFQLKGDLIMVSANIVETLEKILPVEQNLIPVALKRKLEYSGHFMQEYVDREKVKLYFQWFQRHNHIFEDMKLDQNLINQFEEDSLNMAEMEDTEKDKIITNHNEILKQKELVDDLYDSEEEENEEKTTNLKAEHISCDHSSFISDKYMEDINAPTVANKFSDMILELEKMPGLEEIVNPDSEQAFYVEDEIYLSDDEFEDDDDSIDVESFCAEEDMNIWNQIKSARSETRKTIFMIKNDITLCKCALERKISFILKHKFDLEKIIVNNTKSKEIYEKLLNDFSDCIEHGRSRFRNQLQNCNHEEYNTLSSDVKKVIETRSDSEKASKFVEEQLSKIKQNANKVFVAPSEGGKLINWQSDLFLEEKLFPKLFPYGIGGYLSSNMLKNSNMGYSNYIKSRLLSADPKFRNDASYTFFLLLVGLA